MTTTKKNRKHSNGHLSKFGLVENSKGRFSEEQDEASIYILTECVVQGPYTLEDTKKEMPRLDPLRLLLSRISEKRVPIGFLCGSVFDTPK